MSCQIRELLFGLGLILAIASLLPSTLSVPTDLAADIDERSGRDFLGLKELFNGCNGEGKMCGATSGNKNDCCGSKVCLYVQDQLGYYCLRDPTMPYLGGWFGDR